MADRGRFLKVKYPRVSLKSEFNAFLYDCKKKTNMEENLEFDLKSLQTIWPGFSISFAVIYIKSGLH